jgi:hypothetical protein
VLNSTRSNVVKRYSHFWHTRRRRMLSTASRLSTTRVSSCWQLGQSTAYPSPGTGKRALMAWTSARMAASRVSSV